jgi:hypothetical protein
MAANVYPAPDRRRIVGSWVLTVVLSVLTLGSLAGKAEATPGTAPVSVTESVRAA